jgi:hypothetical protein
MSLSHWIVTLAPLGTMASAIVAAATYVTSVLQRSRARTHESANKVRETLQEIASSTQYIVREINEGTALLSAASSVTEAMESRLSKQPLTAELRNIIKDDQLMLSVCISGWHNSAVSSDLYRGIYELRHLGDALFGTLRIYSEALELFIRLIRDGYSPIIFKNILDLIGQDKIDVIDWAQPYHCVLNQLTVQLQSEASLYFVTRYKESTREIEGFISYLTQCLLKLKDKKLLRFERVPLGDEVDATSLTSSMKSLLRDISDALEKEEAAKLLTLIENIETFVSKDHARNKIAAIDSTALADKLD